MRPSMSDRCETRTRSGGQMTMTRELSLQDASQALPPPSFVNGEDAAAYHRLAARFAAAVAPANVIEEMWVRDVVDLVWDVLRLRRLKAGLFTVGASDGMRELLRATGLIRGMGGNRHLAAYWAARDPEGMAIVNTHLSAAGLDMSDVATSTFAAR